jgi:hypothetical protein
MVVANILASNDLVNDQEIMVEFCSSEDADIFTKSLICSGHEEI